MTLLQIVVLAIVQGITQFLPISASSHLVFTTQLFHWPSQGRLFDVAVYAGTLLAVIAYFWRDLWEMLTGAIGAFTGRNSPGLRLVLYLLVATVPVLIAGYVALHYIQPRFRSVEIIAWTTLLLGLLLGFVDRLCMTVRRLEHMSYAGALFIGLAQVLALIPGTSRAGITMTACRILGMERRDAARFSMLLSIPMIVGGAALGGIDLYRAGDVTLRPDAVLATGLAFIAALIAIALTMRWLTHGTFMPFVIYRVILGAGLLYWVYA